MLVVRVRLPYRLHPHAHNQGATGCIRQPRVLLACAQCELPGLIRVAACARADEAAAQVVMDNSQAFLVAMQHSGVFTGQLATAVDTTFLSLSCSRHTHSLAIAGWSPPAL